MDLVALPAKVSEDWRIKSRGALSKIKNRYFFTESSTSTRRMGNKLGRVLKIKEFNFSSIFCGKLPS